jgi:dUTP pyrophosphatase
MDELNLDEAQSKLLDALNPENDYSMEEWENEFHNMNNSFSVGNPNVFKIPLKFVNKSDNVDPEYAKDGDSGFDVRAFVDKTVVIQPARLNVRRTTMKTDYGDKEIVESVELIPAETKRIPTGLFFEIPRGYEIQVRSRSGLSANAQIVVTNSPGTVDSCYRGELEILLTNHGNKVFYVEKGDRIAQCVFASVLDNHLVGLEKVEEIDTNTDRGDGGFGHTGIK